MDTLFGIFTACCYIISILISARTPEAKASQIARKRKIQERLRSELGILVDIVKEGYGNTNVGNTARKFFENPEKTAKIIGLDASLIRRFAIILQTIASDEQIEPKKFDTFAKETASLFVELYGWYFMPVSIHKILLHEDILQYLLVISDPYITSLRPKLSKSKRKTFFPEVADLLMYSADSNISLKLDVDSD